MLLGYLSKIATFFFLNWRGGNYLIYIYIYIYLFLYVGVRMWEQQALFILLGFTVFGLRNFNASQTGRVDWPQAKVVCLIFMQRVEVRDTQSCDFAVLV